MDPPAFTNHFRTLIRGMRRCGLVTPWISSSVSPIFRLLKLLYDVILLAIPSYLFFTYVTAAIHGLPFEFVCSAGIGSSCMMCGISVTGYHIHNSRRLKKITDDMDAIAQVVFRSGLGKEDLLQELYERIAKRVFVDSGIYAIIICAFVYSMSLPVMDWFAGNYRTRHPLPIRSLFDDKVPWVYELIILIECLGLAIPCCKKDINDWLFIVLFRIHRAYLEYLGAAMESLKVEIDIGNKAVIRKKLVMWISLHQQVLRNVEELVQIFSPVVVIYYLNVIGIVVCGLFIQIMKESDNLFQSLGVGAFVLITVLQLFQLSNAAGDLTLEAEKISSVLYSVPWYLLHPRHAAMLRQVMMVSNRQVHVTAYKIPMFILNRETFRGFLMSAGSALVTLVQMKEHYG